MVINLLGNPGNPMSLAEAIDAPRLHHRLDPDILEYEEGYDPDVIAYLKDMGHDQVVKYPNGTYICAVNGVAKMNETVSGHADIRTEGRADTY